MTFQEAAKKTPGLEEAYKAGLQALRAEDKPHFVAADTRCLTGSVDIDSALQKIEPNANRWDFAVAYQHTNRAAEFIYWVELHTGSDSEVKVVIRKAQWLANWLRNAGKLLADFECSIIWLSSGATSFTLSAPQRKQMAEVGLQHKGSILRILERRPD
jgi:hypothetical protein